MINGVVVGHFEVRPEDISDYGHMSLILMNSQFDQARQRLEDHYGLDKASLLPRDMGYFVRQVKCKFRYELQPGDKVDLVLHRFPGSSGFAIVPGANYYGHLPRYYLAIVNRPASHDGKPSPR